MKQITLSLLLLAFLSVLFLYVLGVRLNISPSIPVGLYRISGEEIATGKYVIFNPVKSQLFDEAKANGYLCKGVFHEYMPLFKKVSAVGGDTITISPKGIFLNGSFIAKSIPLERDNLGRGLPKLNINEHLLREGEFILIGETADSFDSRYFGVVKKVNIGGVIKGIFCKN